MWTSQLNMKTSVLRLTAYVVHRSTPGISFHSHSIRSMSEYQSEHRAFLAMKFESRFGELFSLVDYLRPTKDKIQSVTSVHYPFFIFKYSDCFAQCTPLRLNFNTIYSITLNATFQVWLTSKSLYYGKLVINKYISNALKKENVFIFTYSHFNTEHMTFNMEHGYVYLSWSKFVENKFITNAWYTEHN